MIIRKLSDSVEKVMDNSINNLTYLRIKDGTWLCLFEWEGMYPFVSMDSDSLEKEYQERLEKDSEKIKIAEDIIKVEYFSGLKNLFGEEFVKELQEKIKDHFRSAL